MQTAIWAAVHVIGNGDSASIVFFGAFLITALAVAAWVVLLLLHPILFGTAPAAW
ncbi:MAG: NnrU family protein [Acetobacteraceae bacterium]